MKYTVPTIPACNGMINEDQVVKDIANVLHITDEQLNEGSGRDTKFYNLKGIILGVINEECRRTKKQE